MTPLALDLSTSRGHRIGRRTGIGEVNDTLGARIGALEVNVAKSISAATNRGFLLYIGLAAAMFGTMARGFGWI